MNLENRNLFEKWINRAIEEKVTEREEELELDMEFPFSIQLEGKSFERNFLKICGELHPDILGSNQARIKVDEVRAVYGNEHEISKEIRVIPLLQTQFKFVPDKRICVPLSTRMYLKKKYLNTVLFYEP